MVKLSHTWERLINASLRCLKWRGVNYRREIDGAVFKTDTADALISSSTANSRDDTNEAIFLLILTRPSARLSCYFHSPLLVA